jgi:hypothetical protein
MAIKSKEKQTINSEQNAKKPGSVYPQFRTT